MNLPCTTLFYRRPYGRIPDCEKYRTEIDIE